MFVLIKPTKTIAKNSRSLKVSGENDWNPQFNVQAAIRKVESMQLANGAVSYWQGGDNESWWGTAFATHFLLEATKADYEVNEFINNVYNIFGIESEVRKQFKK
jgi:uncharacterized protein YfaS (alpha-2-macroglobulin family)